jgi:hypothetical protein
MPERRCVNRDSINNGGRQVDYGPIITIGAIVVGGAAGGGVS